MLARVQIERLASACTEIGNAVADSDGFVSMRRLLDQFKADLVIRPLLVEGMLTSNGNRWSVLIDEDQSAITQQQIEEETATKPLPARVRNTIAHELTHSLAFRTVEFGVELRDEFGARQRTDDWLAAIEGAMEKLSPLLLMPEVALRNQLSSFSAALTLQNCLDLKHRFGVSRDVFVNRLRLLKDSNSRLLELPALNRCAVGIGHWRSSADAQISGWPLFYQFDRNVLPAPVLALLARKETSAAELLLDPQLVTNGGHSLRNEFSCDAGIPNVPQVSTMRVQLEIEQTRKLSGARFLFVLAENNPR